MGLLYAVAVEPVAVATNATTQTMRNRSEKSAPSVRSGKPLSAFHKHKICLYGVESLCKQCKFRKRKERDAKYPDRIRSMDLKAKYPDRIRSMDLKAKYGMTIADYNAMHA